MKTIHVVGLDGKALTFTPVGKHECKDGVLTLDYQINDKAYAVFFTERISGYCVEYTEDL